MTLSTIARAVMALLVMGSMAEATTAADAQGYDRVAPSVDGSGIVYLGRETAAFLGDGSSHWLVRPGRVVEDRPDLLVQALALKPGMQVADIGSGAGDNSGRMAEQVAPGGRVYAVDIDQGALDRLVVEMERRGVSNVEPVLGAIDDPRLPLHALDVVLLFELYHELDHPREMLDGIVRSLKSDGRVVFVEYRAEDASLPIKPHHRMSVAQLRREAEASGLIWDQTIETLPLQHIVIFRNASRPD